MAVRITDTTGNVTDVDCVFVNGLATIPLGGDFAVTVHDTSPVGTTWYVTATARPSADLGALIGELEQLDAPVLLELFGVDPQEPYLSWRNIWQADLPAAYRLGAVIMALATRTDELRSGGPHGR